LVFGDYPTSLDRTILACNAANARDRSSAYALTAAISATVIRILLVPATMRILGDWNWWPGGRKTTFANPKKKADGQ